MAHRSHGDAAGDRAGVREIAAAVRAWRVVSHGVLGWLLFPLRYLDLLLLRSPKANRIGNHYYIWLRKPL